MEEMEVKILDINLEKLRELMKKNNIPLIKKEDQINNIYDFEDRRLLKNKGYARIREVHNLITNTEEYYMTVKRMLSQEVFKRMEESETTIENGDEGKKIFKALGLVPVEIIKKYRESYKYKNTLIEIDINSPEIYPHPYLEIETSSKEEFYEVLDLLGYTEKDTTSKTIYEILKERNIKSTIPEGL